MFFSTEQVTIGDVASTIPMTTVTMAMNTAADVNVTEVPTASASDKEVPTLNSSVALKPFWLLTG